MIPYQGKSMLTGRLLVLLLAAIAMFAETGVWYGHKDTAPVPSGHASAVQVVGQVLDHQP